MHFDYTPYAKRDHLIAIVRNTIIVLRDKRQRRKPDDIEDLKNSINEVGLINPVTITKNMILIAGERRLQACLLLNPEYKVPVRFREEMSEEELQLLEYEENAKRQDLSSASC